MSLARIWTPSPNKSSGGTKRLLVIHSMEGFTGPNGAYDCATYFQKSSAGASSQVCIDNNRGTVWEGVTRVNGSWTQCGFNSVSISCEQSGYASWSRDYWLSARDSQLWNIAEWLAEESAITGIPLVDLSASQAQSGSWGVCYHSELGSTGCGHSDPGAGWPFDVVLQRARDFLSGGPSVPEEIPEEDEDEMPYLNVPPKAERDRPVCMSLNGFHSTIGLGVDASGGIGNVNVRCAGHIGNNKWVSANVYGDGGHNKVVYSFRDGSGAIQKFDIIRVDREDDADCDITLNFGK